MTKKKIFFFNYPVNTNKICLVISDKNIDQLRLDGVIPKNSAYLIEEYDEKNKDPDYLAKIVHVDKLLFDNYTNPKTVIFDLDLLGFYFVQIYKQVRGEVFLVLDNLQMRAMMKGKNDIVKMIEEDKQKLRDMPDKLSFSECKTPSDVFKVFPEELTVDYKEKYEHLV
jgi:hypothetical protein